MFFYFADEQNNSILSLVTFKNSDAKMEIRRYVYELCTDNKFAINTYPIVKKLFIKYNTPLPSFLLQLNVYFHLQQCIICYNKLADQTYFSK